MEMVVNSRPATDAMARFDALARDGWVNTDDRVRFCMLVALRPSDLLRVRQSCPKLMVIDVAPWFRAMMARAEARAVMGVK